MRQHTPDGYRCPFCRLAAGEDLSGEFSKQVDIVSRDDVVTAFISSAWWPGNDGNAIVIPNAHYENVYAVPDDVLAATLEAGTSPLADTAW
jgi:histidine triad (HIT) family protein